MAKKPEPATGFSGFLPDVGGGSAKMYVLTTRFEEFRTTAAMRAVTKAPRSVPYA
jgi:hypothetical protein